MCGHFAVHSQKRMVRLELTFDAKTITYKWEVVDPDFASVVEVQTENKLICLPNWPDKANDKVTTIETIVNDDKHAHHANVKAELVAVDDTELDVLGMFPLTRYMIVRFDKHNHVYNPVRSKWMQIASLTQLSDVLCAISTEILNHVLRQIM